MSDSLDAFPVFVRAVAARLEAGRKAYGDRSFSRTPIELLGELELEAEDLAGWGFVLWHRLRSMRAALANVGPVGPSRAGETLPAVSEDAAEVGRVVRVARPGPVLVVPLTRQPDRTLARGPALELSRVPCFGEWIDVGGALARVVAVRHLVDGCADAEVQVEPLAPALEATAVERKSA